MPEDVEVNTEETKGNVSHDNTFVKNNVDFLQLCFKIIEVVFCIVSVVLLSEPASVTPLVFKNHFAHIVLAYSCFVSYILINSILVLGRLLQEPIGVRTSLLFSIVGAGLFFVTAILLFVDRASLDNSIFYPRDYVKNMWVASASFALINAVVFIIDIIYTIMKREDI